METMTAGDLSHQHLSKCSLRYQLMFVFKERYCGYVGDVSMTIISYILLYQQLEDGGRDKRVLIGEHLLFYQEATKRRS